MRRIVYAGTVFYTGDRIASAVLEYARALARHGTADTVMVPSRTSAGDLDSVEVLLGPASQMASEPAELVGVEIEDAGFVADIERLTAALGPLRPAPEEPAPNPGTAATYDDLL